MVDDKENIASGQDARKVSLGAKALKKKATE